MAAEAKFTINGPQWWVDAIVDFRSRLERAVAEGKLKLPLTVTDDATDGAILYLKMDTEGNFEAKGSPTLTQTSVALAATILSDGKKHPL
jgi:predicted RecA/RadA family phage recombinase